MGRVSTVPHAAGESASQNYEATDQGAFAL